MSRAVPRRPWISIGAPSALAGEVLPVLADRSRRDASAPSEDLPPASDASP